MKTNLFKWTLALCFIGLTLVSCKKNTENMHPIKQLSETNVISVVALEHSKSFDQASLKISSLEVEKLATDSVRLYVRYEIENFELTQQTEHDHHMANSHDGQHIHFILDNQPYVALYKPEHSVVIPINSKHYLLSFLSRSYHESIKTEKAFDLTYFKIDSQGNLEILPKPTEPGLFYSRPKGDYVGEDAKELLLDFFITNCSLDNDTYRVNAIINDTEFVLDKWIPYKIIGLQTGKNTIRLNLIDKEANVVEGDNTSVERIFFLKEK